MGLFDLGIVPTHPVRAGTLVRTGTYQDVGASGGGKKTLKQHLSRQEATGEKKAGGSQYGHPFEYGKAVAGRGKTKYPPKLVELCGP